MYGTRFAHNLELLMSCIYRLRSGIYDLTFGTDRIFTFGVSGLIKQRKECNRTALGRQKKLIKWSQKNEVEHFLSSPLFCRVIQVYNILSTFELV